MSIPVDPANGASAPIAAPASRGRVLIVDDEETVVRVLTLQLAARGFEVASVTDPAMVLGHFMDRAPDAVVLDHGLPGTTGLDLLARMKEIDPSVTVVVLSGSIDVPQTVQALRAGADDVQTKPAEIELLAVAIERGLARTRLLRSRRLRDTQVQDPFGLLDDSPAMLRVRQTIEGLARSTAPVLITGERGTGKGTVAEMLHQTSPLADRPFVTIACDGRDTADLDRALMGAIADEAASPASGMIARAHGGTIFLNDLGVIAPSTQTLLLALLDPRVRARHAWAPAHVRLLTATRRDLAEDVRRGHLRAELHQRLAVVPLTLPSLRQRGPAAIESLARRIVQRQRVEVAEGPFDLSEAALQLLGTLEWPGNARELRLVLEDAFVRASDSATIEPVHLWPVLDRRGLAKGEVAPVDEDLTLDALTRAHIAKVLARAEGNRTLAARLLGITRTTLYKKIADFGLDGSAAE